MAVNSKNGIIWPPPSSVQDHSLSSYYEVEIQHLIGLTDGWTKRQFIGTSPYIARRRSEKLEALPKLSRSIGAENGPIKVSSPFSSELMLCDWVHQERQEECDNESLSEGARKISGDVGFMIKDHIRMCRSHQRYADD